MGRGSALLRAGPPRRAAAGSPSEGSGREGRGVMKRVRAHGRVRPIAWMARETRRVVTGQVQALAAGSPAVLVCAGACALAFQIGTTGDDRRISRYLLE